MRLFTGIFLCFLILFCQPNPLFQNEETNKLASDFKLFDTNQNPFHFYEVSKSKSLVVLFFGYSHCPDICVSTLKKFSKLIETLPAESLKQIQFIFISVDPKNDNPSELKEYMKMFSKEIVALTGNVDEIKKITKEYELVLFENPKYGKIKGEGKMIHSTNIYLIKNNHTITKSLPHQLSLETLKQEIADMLH